MKSKVVRAYGAVDKSGSRYLLGDHLGNLFMLVLEYDGGKLTELKLEPLGEVNSEKVLVNF
jgi:DNA damage-binding protein 1